MAKNKSKKTPREDPGATAGALSHNPFAALSATATVDAASDTRRQPAPSVVAPSDRPPTASPSARFPSQIVIRREKKGRGGKTITRLSGVPTDGLSSLTGEMKKALGCGATAEGADLILLGSLVDRAAAWLSEAGADKIVKGN